MTNVTLDLKENKTGLFLVTQSYLFIEIVF
jgi:hypothetical protein